ncbi:MAG TPA: tripartite tricarboxylate transporter substrate-binding protein, partial [Burkholderiales bacterium]|nr:tripartite tricarboxylate transporter substrate-binding protein [Burkholderiales bacterium]
MQPIVVFVIVMSVSLFFAHCTEAQIFPSRPIRIVTAQPGSGNDILARLIAQGAMPRLGQQVIVDNRGSPAIDIVQKSAPDGYNLLLYGSVLWLLPFMRDNVGYDPVGDFVPVTWGTTTPNVLVIHPLLPVKSVQELVALAK